MLNFLLKSKFKLSRIWPPWRDRDLGLPGRRVEVAIWGRHRRRQIIRGRGQTDGGQRGLCRSKEQGHHVTGVHVCGKVSSDSGRGHKYDSGSGQDDLRMYSRFVWE